MTFSMSFILSVRQINSVIHITEEIETDVANGSSEAKLVVPENIVKMPGLATALWRVDGHTVC